MTIGEIINFARLIFYVIFEVLKLKQKKITATPTGNGHSER